MAQLQATALLDRIRDLVGGSGPTDDELLRRFIGDRDEAAFARLVKRHGPMVLSVCRGVLRQHQDAEDAFQATFLVLAKSAPAIQKRQSLGGWLHGVAFRVSLKSRGRAARRPAAAAISVDDVPGAASDDVDNRELRGVVHEELHRLPDAYSSPLLLCYFEGMTRDEAARRLGMTPDSFKKRLEKARELLGRRLVRRGVAPALATGAALLPNLSASAASAAIPIELTAKAAAAFAAKSGATVPASAAAVNLAKGLVKSMIVVQWVKRAALALAIVATTVGSGIIVHRVLAGGQGAALQGEKGGGVITGGGGAGAEAAAADDKKRFVGEWKLTKVATSGKEVPPPEFFEVARFHFGADGKVKFAVGEDRVGTYSIPNPGQIDLNVFGPDDSGEAIYKFDGNDRVAIGFRERIGKKDRPTDFATKKGDNLVVLQLERIGPNDKKASPEALERAMAIRETAARSISQNTIRQIGLAFHMLADTDKSQFPAHAIYSKDGKTPLLSWRVAILPYIEQKALYDQFKLDEPWDSEHNKKLISKMPRLYEAPLGETQPGKTYYQVFTGKGTAFDGAKKLAFKDFTDGTSNTILLAEAKNPVIWTQPADIVLPNDAEKGPEIGGLFKSGSNALFADGSVMFISPQVDPAVLRPFLTPAGGELVNRESLMKKK